VAAGCIEDVVRDRDIGEAGLESHCKTWICFVAPKLLEEEVVGKQ